MTLLMSLNNDPSARIVETIKDLGRAEGLGKNSRPEFALEVMRATQMDLVNPDEKKAIAGAMSVDQVFTIYTQARAEAQGDKDGAKQASEKQQVSKLRQLVKLAVWNKGDPIDVIERTRAIANSDENVKGSTYDAMVKIAREQLKSDRPFNDDEIKGFLVPNQADEPTDAERERDALASHIKKLTTLHDGTDEKSPRPSAELAAAIGSLQARHAQVEAEIAAVDAENKAAKAAAFTAKASTNAEPAPLADAA